MTPMLQGHIRDIEGQLQKQTTALAAHKKDIVQHQRKERSGLETAQEARRAQEAQIRAQRFRKGIRGLWDRVIGNHKKITRQNEDEIQQCLQRDRSEKERLIFSQLDERRSLHKTIKQTRQANSELVADLHRDITGYLDMSARLPSKRKHLRQSNHQSPRALGRSNDLEREI